MKKIILAALALTLTAGVVNAKELSEARIYLNPGHGSWGPNDRPMATIPYPALPETGRPDTCGFYESNTNLWKVLKLGSVLESLGAKKENIMYSRVKNGPFPYVKGAPDESQFNRSLSEICEEVEANNMDYFLSVHSNAASEGSTTNYPLFIYRGKDGQANEYQAGSYEKADIAWDYVMNNGIDVMTNYLTSKNIRGDVSFYGSESGRTDPVSGITYKGYLGVLKHGAPGYLSEGYFHTYQPARHRALNMNYCHQEGVRYARSIAAYFGSPGETTGYIMGTVKDKNEKMNNNLYKYGVGSIDQWLPINGAVVTLYKDGVKVKDYTVDNNTNGVFVFEGLAPGNYTLDCTADTYKVLEDVYKAPIEVKANATTYPLLYMESENYVPPVPDPIVYENYPDPKQDGYIGLADNYVVKTEFGNSPIAALDGKTVRRSILRGDSLYVLAHDADKAPHLYIINPETQQIITTLITTGTTGGINAISDIAFTADNFLVACNSEVTQFAGTPGVFRVYKWNKFDEAPVEWFTSPASGNWLEATTGNALAFSGTTKKGKLITTAVTTGSSKKMRFVIFEIEDNLNTGDYFNKNDDFYTEVALGSDYDLNVSPLADDHFIFDGSNSTPVEFKIIPEKAAVVTNMGQIDANALSKEKNGASYFKYAKKALMVAPNSIFDARLFDVTNGLSTAKEIIINNITNANATDATNNIVKYAGALVDNANINIYTGSNNISKFTTKAVEQPVIKGVYARDLKVAVDGDNYDFSFVSNDDVAEGALIFFDQATGAEVNRVSISLIKEGQNSVKVAKTDIPVSENKLDWSIQLIGNAIPTITRLTDKGADKQYLRATGVAVDNSPESDFFGRIYIDSYVTGATADRTITKKGLFAYNADWTPINNDAYNGGSANLATPYRIGIDSKGKVYISDWSDGNSGIYIADPANLEGDYVNLFAGLTRDGNGLFTTAQGVAVGGSTPGVNILGTGDNTKLYCYSEDLVSPTGKYNNIAIYNIGSDKTSWNEAPSNLYDIGVYQANTNGNIVATADGGVWVAQTRSSGNNTPGVPVLIYVDATGKVVFNSGVSMEDLSGCWGSGFAISPDGKQLIVNNVTKDFQCYDIKWNEGVPVLTYKYSYKHDVGDNKDGGNIYQMQFDYAGNLVVAGGYMAVYSFPNDNNQTITPAKKSFAIDGNTLQLLPPTNLQYSVVNEDLVLNWDAPIEQNNVAAPTYNVTVDGIVNKSDVSETTCTISGLSVGTHEVGVTAKYFNGQESTPATISVIMSGVEDINGSISIMITPNPTTGMINITSSEEVEAVNIYNVSGALVLSTNESTVDVSNFAAGIYFVKVNNHDPIRIIKK